MSAQGGDMLPFSPASMRKIMSQVVSKLQAEQQTLVSTASKLKEEGNEKYKNGDFKSAIDLYTQAVEYMDKFPGEHAERAVFINNRAAVYLKLCDYYNCVIDCTLVLGLSPGASQTVKALNRRGQAYENIPGRLNDALADYKAALAIEAKNKESQDGEARVKAAIAAAASRTSAAKPPPGPSPVSRSTPAVEDPRPSDPESIPQAAATPSTPPSYSAAAVPPESSPMTDGEDEELDDEEDGDDDGEMDSELDEDEFE